MRVKRGCSSRLASTTCPSIQRRRRVKAAKLMRTWKAIRVFSGTTSSGPFRSASATSRRKVATTAGSPPARCSARSWRPHACGWLRLANTRPQRGQVHSGRSVTVPP
jgi:hypothetical protein